MPLQGEYVPSPEGWVRDQVEAIESSGGTDGLLNQGVPVILVTNRGAKSGKLRKTPLMRIEHDGVYAAVASAGGDPKHPFWYWNFKKHPEVEVRDATEVSDMTAREITGEEYDTWWERGLAVWPLFADYQSKTDRKIPVFVLESTQA